MPDFCDMIMNRSDIDELRREAPVVKESVHKAHRAVDQVILTGQTYLCVTSMETDDQRFIKNLTDYLRNNKNSWRINIFELKERSVFIDSLFTYIENCIFTAQVEMLRESKVKSFNTGIIFADQLYQLLTDRRGTLEQKKAIIFAVTLLFFPTPLSNIIIDYSGLKSVSDVPIQPHYAGLFGLSERTMPRQLVASIEKSSLNLQF
jgi:hypothetical protein